MNAKAGFPALALADGICFVFGIRAKSLDQFDVGLFDLTTKST